MRRGSQRLGLEEDSTKKEKKEQGINKKRKTSRKDSTNSFEQCSRGQELKEEKKSKGPSPVKVIRNTDQEQKAFRLINLRLTVIKQAKKVQKSKVKLVKKQRVKKIRARLNLIARKVKVNLKNQNQVVATISMS